MPEHLNTCVEACYRQTEHFFQRGFPRPTVSFRLYGQKTGIIHPDENLLCFNPQLYRENREYFLEQTVAHEVAHLIMHQLFGPRIRPHDERWQLTMRGIYDLPPDHYHIYAVKHRIITRYLHRCHCPEHNDLPFSPQRHTLVAKGRRYYCRCYRATLALTGEVLRERFRRWPRPPSTRQSVWWSSPGL